MAACVSRLELSVRCRSLLDRDVRSGSDPLCVLLQDTGRGQWAELDRTERIKNCQDPEFSKKLVVDYYFEKVQKLKFGVYDIDNKTFDLNDDDYLGGIECTLGQVVSSLVFTRPLELKQGKPAGKGTITISAEEIKDTRVVYLEIEAQNLDKKDFLGKSDPFLEFYKQSDAGTWQLVYRSEVIKNNLNPCWRKFSVPLQTFCGGDFNKPIKVQCVDHDSDGSHDLIGVAHTTLAQVQTAGPDSPVELECIHPEKKQKKKSYKNSGIIRIKSCKIETEYSFLDYVMGGCQINFTVGVDFTASNGDPKSPDSLHYISPDGINEYLIAIWSVGSVVQDYDTDKLFPAFGFGAQVPPSWQVSDEFALNFNPSNPYCQDEEWGDRTALVGPSQSSSDWVEIIEPRSQERMYVNLTTGECGWEPPPNLKVRQSDQKQWWELFDQNNNRFYYYNAITRQTVWHRPQGCDIVPLAQLQAMKRGSQPDCRGRQHRGSTGSDGRSTPIQMALLQEMEKGKWDCAAEKRKDPGRETPTQWQPLPGTKAAMLVKVNSLRQIQSFSNSSLQLQSAPEPSSPKPAIYAQPQPTSQSPGATKQMPAGETKQSMQIKKTENGGFCLVLMNGPTSQTPPRSRTGTPQPTSPKCASPAPIYDEPSLESPIYDEPPVDMDTESIAVSGMSPPRSPSNSLKKQLQPTKLLQHPSLQQQQAAKKHARNPSSTEYSPAGREYIKHMVNVDQSAKLSHSSASTADASAKLPGQLASKDSFKQSWRILEANVLKNMELHHSRQNSLQTQEYPTAISHQDSGYSTGPSPSLRKRKGRRQGTGQVRPGSVGSSSELTALNDKVIAEMRAVVGRSAACRGSKASLDAESLESGVPAESSKVRFQSDHLKKCISRSSRDDVSASNRSLYRQGLEMREGFPSDAAAPQDTLRQKRTFEKIDSLEKNVTSQTSLASSDATRHSSQPGTIELDPKQEDSGQRGGCVGCHFPYNTLRKPISQSSMADWASKNLNMHTQGIFRRRISISNMLSWNGGSIKKPMLITSNRTIKKEACEMFKLVQSYMGDRQTRMDRNHVALVTVTKCWSMQGLRDELYIQLIRQTTDNTCYRSLAWGWELMAISLAFFSPSPKFQSYLEGYIYRHLDSDENIAQRIKELVDLKNKKNSKSRKKRKQNTEDEGLPISTYAKYCYRKLQKVAITGGKKGLRKPTVEEITHARNAILTPSLFGSSLEEIMLRQQDMYPGNKLPWVQTQLSQQVLALGGEQTEGIFRIPGDIDEVNALKLQVDQWRMPSSLSDPNIPASLLKLWYRELEEPVIPQQFYKECISNYENPDAAVAVVQLLPELNRLVLCYLIHFLQIFAQPSNVGRTKMDVNNLAMVMAPNCLRCQSDDPRVIFENTRKEMSFLRMLIVHLDTSFIKGLV